MKGTTLPEIDTRCETKRTNPDELWADWRGGRLSLSWGSEITSRPFFFFFFLKRCPEQEAAHWGRTRDLSTGKETQDGSGDE